MTLSLQTMALTARLRHAMAVHIMNKQVPEFQACKCHGRGIRTRTVAMRATTGKAGYSGLFMTMRGWGKQ